MPFNLPREPIITFWSGDDAVVKRMVPTMKEGQPHMILFMRLSQDMLERYGLDEDKFNIPTVFVKAYPSKYIYTLSPDATNQRFLCMANFDGTITIESAIQIISEKNRQLQDEVNTAYIENEKLRVAYKEAIEMIGEFGNVVKKGG